jgi:hypothetical protein
MITTNMKSIAKRASDAATKAYVRGMIEVNELKDKVVERRLERGDIIQTVLIIAVVVGLVIVVFNILSPQITGSAQRTADRIRQAG